MTDRLTVRLVVVGLVVLALAVVVGGIVLALGDRTIPEALVAIGAGAAGALGALLARTSSEHDATITLTPLVEHAGPDPAAAPSADA